jgi:hypothetical protein
VITESERQAIIDDEQLRLLPVFYWVLGGMDILFALYGLIYIAMGLFFALIPLDAGSSSSGPPPTFIGWFFFAFGAAFMLGFGISAALKIATGFWIKKRRRRTACLVKAGITCISIPFGTIVGVFTFLALLRPSVAALFAGSAAVAPVYAGEGPASVPPASRDDGAPVV